jgi:two-component system alkaline phosphatase synthesis response regulator PhoP
MIYLLEDDDSIRNFVIYGLNTSNLPAEGFDRPSAFWAALRKQKPQLVLLDIMLPEEDGLSVLKKLRADSEYVHLPIIMLTAKSTEYDKVIGLDSGADDYVAKPFGIMELISRIKALLRRTEREKQSTFEYQDAELTVSQQRRVVMVDNREIALTFKEFELLCMLLKNRGTVLTRDRILRSIWGYDFDGENRTVDVHIRTLRAKLGTCGERIETVRGVGYRMGDRK